MSKKDGMVQMVELTVYQMRKVVHRELIESRRTRLDFPKAYCRTNPWGDP